MNERMKQLRNLAWKEAYGVDPSDPRIARAHATMEAGMSKFAELLIRECAAFVDDQTEDTGSGVAAGWCEGADLLKHFGVKE
jgi:hypothetical protein